MKSNKVREFIEEAAIKAKLAPLMDKEVAKKLMELGFLHSPFAPVMAKSFYVSFIVEAEKIDKLSSNEVAKYLMQQAEDRKATFLTMLDNFKEEIALAMQGKKDLPEPSVSETKEV